MAGETARALEAGEDAVRRLTLLSSLMGQAGADGLTLEPEAVDGIVMELEAALEALRSLIDTAREA